MANAKFKSFESVGLFDVIAIGRKAYLIMHESRVPKGKRAAIKFLMRSCDDVNLKYHKYKRVLINPNRNLKTQPNTFKCPRASGVEFEYVPAGNIPELSRTL